MFNASSDHIDEGHQISSVLINFIAEDLQLPIALFTGNGIRIIQTGIHCLRLYIKSTDFKCTARDIQIRMITIHFQFSTDTSAYLFIFQTQLFHT